MFFGSQSGFCRNGASSDLGMMDLHLLPPGAISLVPGVGDGDLLFYAYGSSSTRLHIFLFGGPICSCTGTNAYLALSCSGVRVML